MDNGGALVAIGLDYKKFGLSVLAYLAALFVIEGLLSVIAEQIILADVSHGLPRPSPFIFLPGGILRGLALAAIFPFTRFTGQPAMQGLKFGALVALLMLPSEFNLLAIQGADSLFGFWVYIHSFLGLAKYVVAGILIGLIHAPKEDHGNQRTRTERKTDDPQQIAQPDATWTRPTGGTRAG